MTTTARGVVEGDHAHVSEESRWYPMSAHDRAYLLGQFRHCGRHLGGQLGTEAEVAAGHGKDRKPCGQAPEHPR